MSGWLDRLEARSEREKRLLSCAVFFAIIGLYGTQRYMPLSSEFEVLERESSQIEASVQSTKIPKLIGRDSSSIAGESESVTERLSEIDRELVPLENRFSDLSSPAGVQKLMVMVSRLASESGVVIRETAPAKVRRTRRGDSLAESLAGGRLYQRPMRTLVVEGEYHALRRFLVGLGELEQRVVVLEFSLEAMPDTNDESSIPWIRSSVLVAL